MSDKRILGAHQ